MMAPFFSTSSDEVFSFPSDAITLSAGCVLEVGEVIGSSERVEKVSTSMLATTQKLPMENGSVSTNILNTPGVVIPPPTLVVVVGIGG